MNNKKDGLKKYTLIERKINWWSGDLWGSIALFLLAIAFFYNTIIANMVAERFFSGVAFVVSFFVAVEIYDGLTKEVKKTILIDKKNRKTRGGLKKYTLIERKINWQLLCVYFITPLLIPPTITHFTETVLGNSLKAGAFLIFMCIIVEVLYFISVAGIIEDIPLEKFVETKRTFIIDEKNKKIRVKNE